MPTQRNGLLVKIVVGVAIAAIAGLVFGAVSYARQVDVNTITNAQQVEIDSRRAGEIAEAMRLVALLQKAQIKADGRYDLIEERLKSMDQRQVRDQQEMSRKLEAILQKVHGP